MKTKYIKLGYQYTIERDNARNYTKGKHQASDVCTVLPMHNWAAELIDVDREFERQETPRRQPESQGDAVVESLTWREVERGWELIERGWRTESQRDRDWATVNSLREGGKEAERETDSWGSRQARHWRQAEVRDCRLSREGGKEAAIRRMKEAERVRQRLRVEAQN